MAFIVLVGQKATFRRNAQAIKNLSSGHDWPMGQALDIAGVGPELFWLLR